MLPKKFTELMTIHADNIVSRTVADIRDHPRTRHYHNMPAAEMKKRIMGIFKNMEHYLEEGDIEAIYELYRRFGRTRYYEGIPLPDLMYAFTLVKHHIRDFIKTHMLSDTALQLHHELQFLERTSSFFDDVFYYTITGYQEAFMEETRKRAHHDHD
jgi:hypothetical protein